MDPKKEQSVGGRLTGKKIQDLVRERGMTLEEIAENHGMDFEKFITLAKKLVGQKKFVEVQQRSDANAKRNKRQEKKTETATNMGAKGQEVIPASENLLTEAERLEALRRALKTIKAKETEAEAKLDTAKRNYSKYDELAVRASAECARIRKELESAQREEQRLHGLRNKAEEDKNDAQADITYWHIEASNVEGRIKELENSTIYLVHPKYPHALPEKGTFVSCAEVHHPNYKNDSGEELVEEPSWTPLKNMGYQDFDEVEADIEFAKLVVKYLIEAEEGRQCYILVEDQRMKKLLELQGIDASEYLPE